MQTISAAGDPRRQELELALGEGINAVVSAARALSERSAAHFHPQLQPAAFHIARWLYAFGPAKPSEVAEAVHMDRSSTSTLIGKMRSLGLLEASPNPDDKRSVIVGLSVDGRERVAATLDLRGDVFRERIRDWSDGDLSQLVDLLGRLTSERNP
jgi:DNA-binding MarR family transcriptional regulator